MTAHVAVVLLTILSGAIKSERANVDPASIPTAITADLAHRGITRIEPMPPGMSGASLFRCSAPSGEAIALKCWPSATSAARVDEVHRIVARARSAGCNLIPNLITWTQHGATCPRWTESDRHWEAMQWLPGKPLGIDASLPEIRAGAAAVATFHRSVSILAESRQPAPAVIARLVRLRELDSIVPQLKPTPELPPSLRAAVENARQLLDWRWNRVRNELWNRLRRYEQQPLPLQYVLRDVHRDHVLFENGQPAGLIDFDAVRCDTPMTDLARWAGSFLADRSEEDRDAVWDAATAGFRVQWASPYCEALESEPTLARDLCHSAQWISLANWLDWVLIQRRSFAGGPDRIAARIGELVRSLA